MPVENHFFLVVAERPKEAPASASKKGLKPNGLQRMTGIAPEIKQSQQRNLLQFILSVRSQSRINTSSRLRSNGQR